MAIHRAAIDGLKGSIVPSATILIVDDEPGIVDIVRVNLLAEGYAVAGASTGKEALAKVRAEAPDLIILDVMLPDISGWQLLEVLEGSTSTAGIPVIILTARASDEDMLHGLEHGAVEYITKPFYPEDLVASVKIILDVFDPSLRQDYRHQLIAKRKRLMSGLGRQS